MSKSLSAIFIISAAHLVVSVFTGGNYLTLSKNRVETDRRGRWRRRVEAGTTRHPWGCATTGVCEKRVKIPEMEIREDKGIYDYCVKAKESCCAKVNVSRGDFD